VKLSLEEEGKWEDFFISESKRTLEIKDLIDKTDKEIDSMVYQLYNLTDDEIKIIESTT
jgi:type II restriction/modification system DNA methylase subunit YeeA